MIIIAVPIIHITSIIISSISSMDIYIYTIYNQISGYDYGYYTYIYIYIVILEYIEYGNLKKHIIKMGTVLRNLCFLLQDYYITIYNCVYMYIYICIKHIYIYPTILNTYIYILQQVVHIDGYLDMGNYHEMAITISPIMIIISIVYSSQHVSHITVIVPNGV